MAFKILIALLGALMLVSAEERKYLPGDENHGKIVGIVGTWQNDLGSIVELEAADGLITGKYMTKVGNANGYYDIIGKYLSVGPSNDKFVVSWVVSWQNDANGNSESSTTWNGIYYPDEGVIYTQYLYVKYQDKANYWKSTRSGSNVFKPYGY